MKRDVGKHRSKILVIAGHDPSGQAGLHCDIGAVTDCGCAVVSVISLLTDPSSHKGGHKDDHGGGHKSGYGGGHKAGYPSGHKDDHKDDHGGGYKSGYGGGHPSGLEAGYGGGHKAGYPSGHKAGHGNVRCWPVSGDVIRAQIRAALAAGSIDAVKIGVLADGPAVLAVRDALAGMTVPVVIDPVWRAHAGGLLHKDDTTMAMLERDLFPRAALITPNLVEAGRLTGRTIGDDSMIEQAARALAARYRTGVLVKGGHLPGDWVIDVFADAGGTSTTWRTKRIAGGNLRGTGCRLASVTAAHLARGDTMLRAVAKGRAYIRRLLIRRAKSDA